MSGLRWTPRELEVLQREAASGDRWPDVAKRVSLKIGRTVTPKSCSERTQGPRRRNVTSPAPEIEIPIQYEDSEDDTAPFQRKGPELVSVPPADRTYVEQAPASHALPPLDLGSRTTERILLLPDTHAPYHDARAWSLAMKFGREFRPDSVVHVGDWIDCFTISDHDKDPRRGSQLESELEVTKELRAEIDALGAQRKVITLGNHEDRLWRYCVRHAPALISMMKIEELLELPQNGWHTFPYRQHASIGSLNLTHEAGYAGIHAVHHTGNAFASSVVFGHTHRLGATYFGDVLGRRCVSASLGWLGAMPAALYEHEAKRMRFWQSAFASVRLEKSGHFHLQLHPIVDGRVVLDGQLVEA